MAPSSDSASLMSSAEGFWGCRRWNDYWVKSPVCESGAGENLGSIVAIVLDARRKGVHGSPSAK